MTEFVMGQTMKLILGAFVITVAIVGISFFFSSSVLPFFKSFFSFTNLLMPEGGWTVTIKSETDYSKELPPEIESQYLEKIIQDDSLLTERKIRQIFDECSNNVGSIWRAVINDESERFRELLTTNKNNPDLLTPPEKEELNAYLFLFGICDHVSTYTNQDPPPLVGSPLTFQSHPIFLYYKKVAILKSLYEISEQHIVNIRIAQEKKSYTEIVQGESINDRFYCNEIHYFDSFGNLNEKECVAQVMKGAITLKSSFYSSYDYGSGVYSTTVPLKMFWKDSEGNLVCNEDKEQNQMMAREVCTLKLNSNKEIIVEAVPLALK